MKRTTLLLFILSFQLIVSSVIMFYTFNIYIMACLLLANIAMLYVLALEPSWKFGSWMLFLLFIELMSYILNIAVAKFFLAYHGYINLASLLFCEIIVAVAHRMNIENMLDEKMSGQNQKTHNGSAGKKHKTPFEEDADEANLPSIHSEHGHGEKQAEKIEIKEFIADPKGIVHLSGCRDLGKYKDSEKTAIGSKRYAQSKYKSCGKCSPFK